MDIWRIIHHQTEFEIDAESSSTSGDSGGLSHIDNQTLEEGRAVFGGASGSHYPHTDSVGTSLLDDSSFPTTSTRNHSESEYRNSSGQCSQRSDRHYSTAMPLCSNQRAPSEFGNHEDFETTTPRQDPMYDPHIALKSMRNRITDRMGDCGARSSSTNGDSGGLWHIDNPILEEERAVFGGTSGSHYSHVGTSVLDDSSFPTTSTGDHSGPLTSPHLNESEYRNSSGQCSQRSERHYSTAMPMFSNPRAPSEFVNYEDFDHQRRSANFQTTTPRQDLMYDPHIGRSQVVVPTLTTSGRLEKSFERNVFAHRGGFPYFPETQNIEHNTSMVSKCGAMECNSCKEMTREPVSLNMSTLTRPPSPSFSRLTRPESGHEPKQTKKRTAVCLRAFRVNASLKAAAATAVFPTPIGKIINTDHIIKFIKADDAETGKCKLCEQRLSNDYSLLRHWIGAHAFKDFQVALTCPHEDHSNSVINSPQRQDIMLAALYSCPLHGCLYAWVGVFTTKDDLNKHVRSHYRIIRDFGEGRGYNIEDKLEQMEERVETYINEHPFWQQVDRRYFFSRNHKLIWLLNQ
ncbi:hypothetical protein BU17DRAFT_65486 [Hysterangium stoloniferum]|nr:hypothetical protein BU17DRAFT_65486 [Hysterangium stoloniferum]